MQKKTTLIWDLSGTLFKPSSQGMSQEKLDRYSFVFHMWSGKAERTRLDDVSFEVLSMLGKQPTNGSYETICLHTGVPLPKIVCDYLAGTINSTEASEKTFTFFNEWAPQHLSSEDEHEVRLMLETFFDPQALATCMKPVKETVELMMQTADRTNHYILSNWDRDSFIPFYTTYKDSTLAPFTRDHIVISADTGHVKPQRAIYEWFLSHMKLDPSSCLFLDDQAENVAAALAVGIDAHRVILKDVGSLAAFLKKQGVL